LIRVVGYLPESWCHRVQAPTMVLAERRSNVYYLNEKPNSLIIPVGYYPVRESCVGEINSRLVSTGKARYSETEWRLSGKRNQGGTAEILFVPEWRRDFCFNLSGELDRSTNRNFITHFDTLHLVQDTFVKGGLYEINLLPEKI